MPECHPSTHSLSLGFSPLQVPFSVSMEQNAAAQLCKVEWVCGSSVWQLDWVGIREGERSRTRGARLWGVEVDRNVTLEPKTVNFAGLEPLLFYIHMKTFLRHSYNKSFYRFHSQVKNIDLILINTFDLGVEPLKALVIPLIFFPLASEGNRWAPVPSKAGIHCALGCCGTIR